MTTRKNAALGALGALTLAGAAAAQTEPVEIRWWYGLSGRLGEEVQAQCARFNEAQEQVEIVCTQEGDYDEIFQKAMAAVRAGNQPHILQVVDRGTATMMLSDAAIPAHQLVEEQDLDIDWEDYFEAIGNYYAGSEGRLWAFPFNSSTAMVYYNVDAVERAGFEEFPRTWEGFEDLLYALRDEAGYDCSLAYTIDLWSDLEQFSAIHQVPIATLNNGYSGLGAELVFHEGLFADHMKRQEKWYDDGLLNYNPEYGSAQRDLFVNDVCPIYFGSIAGYTTTAQAAPDGMNWTVAELPHYADYEPWNNLVGGAALWTMEGFSDEEYEAVGKFFEFIARPEQQKAWSDGTGYFPVTESAYQDFVEEGYYERPENRNRDLAVESLLRKEPTELSKGVRLGNYVEIRNIISEEIQLALNDEKTMDEALAAAARRGNELLRRFEATFPNSRLP